MRTKEKAVREAALDLNKAISEAEASGYVITWPRSAVGLTSLLISASAKVPDEDYDKMTRSELDDIASSKGMNPSDFNTKAEIIEALEKA